MFKRKFFIMAVMPAALIFLLFMISPMVNILYLSLTDYKLTEPGNAAFVGLRQYTRAFTDIRFLAAMGRSFWFSAMSVALTVLVGFIVAYLIQIKGVRFRTFFRTVILLPMLITPMVAGSAFRFMFDYEYGIINYFIIRMGFEKIPFLGTAQWALISAVIADVWQWFPFAAIVFLAGLESIPTEPLEAAKIDGAGWVRILFNIKLPLMKAVIAVVVLIRFMDAFKEFDKLYIMTAGGPGTSSETASLYVWRQSFQYYDTAFAAASGVVMLMVITFICMLYTRVSKSVKGD